MNELRYQWAKKGIESNEASNVAMLDYAIA